MKLELSYNPKTRHLYASRAVLLVAAFTALALVSLLGLILFWGYQKVHLKTPVGETAPISTLGQFAKDVDSLPKDPEKASQAVLDKIKKDYAGKFTLIFFYDGYTDQNEALNNIQILKTTLEIVEPFKSLKDLIATKIFTTEGQKCQVNQKNQNLPALSADRQAARQGVLVCDPKLLESFSRLGIERFKLVIISPKDFLSGAQSARGLNTWIAISTHQGSLTKVDQKRWLGLIFSHELGHSLGLRDEFTKEQPNDLPEFIPATEAELKTSSYAPGQPNCAPNRDTAQNWWNGYIGIFEKVGFFAGCAGNKNFFYPQENTLMSAWPNAESYGAVSEDYLRGVISCFYGTKEAIIFPAGFEATHSAKLKNCDTFRADYPNFWEE